MSARSIHCALALTSTLLGAPLARAATVTDSIPVECGSRATFDDELRARLGADVRLSDIGVAIVPRSGGFHLRMSVGAEQRELEDASCRELFRAAIVIAVSIRLESSQSTPPPEPPPAPLRPASAAPTPPELRFALGSGIAAGTVPRPVLALELEGKALWRWVGVGVHVRYLLPAERRDETRQGADISAVGAGVSGIFRPSPTWEGRLGLAVQRLYGNGVGLDNRYAASVWAAGPTLGLAWAPFRRGPVWAGVGAQGQLSLARGRFEIRNHSGELTGQSHVVYRVPWLSAVTFVHFGLVW